MKRVRLTIFLAVSLVLGLLLASTVSAGPVGVARGVSNTPAAGGSDKVAPGDTGTSTVSTADTNASRIGSFGIEVDMDSGAAVFVTAKGERLNPSDEIIITGDFVIGSIACLDCTGGGPAPGAFRTVEVIGTYTGLGLSSAAGPGAHCIFGPGTPGCWMFSDLTSTNYGIVAGDLGAPGPGVAASPATSTYLAMDPTFPGTPPCDPGLPGFGIAPLFTCEMTGMPPGPWPFRFETKGMLGAGGTFSVFFDVCLEPVVDATVPLTAPHDCGVTAEAICASPPSDSTSNWLHACSP